MLYKQVTFGSDELYNIARSWFLKDIHKHAHSHLHNASTVTFNMWWTARVKIYFQFKVMLCRKWLHVWNLFKHESLNVTSTVTISVQNNYLLQIIKDHDDYMYCWHLKHKHVNNSNTNVMTAEEADNVIPKEAD